MSLRPSRFVREAVRHRFNPTAVAAALHDTQPRGEPRHPFEPDTSGRVMRRRSELRGYTVASVRLFAPKLRLA